MLLLIFTFFKTDICVNNQEDILGMLSQIVRCGHQHDNTVQRNVYYILHDLVSLFCFTLCSFFVCDFFFN